MRNPLRFSMATRIRDRYVNGLLRPEKNDLILDVGCGIGYYCEFLSNRGASVIGLDIDQEAISITQELYPHINFSVCSAGDISFKENSFDKVICTEVLEHIKDNDRVIGEIYRITKPGGLVLITVPCSEGLFGSLIKNICHRDGGSFETHFRNGYSLKTMIDLSERNGLRLLSYNYSMSLLTELYMGITKLIYLFKSGSFTKQADLKDTPSNSLIMRLNGLLLTLFLKIGIAEDKILSKIIKGHMLILLLRK